MSNENDYHNLVNLINSKIDATNSRYPGLVSEELRKNALEIYVNSGKTGEDIDKELTYELEKMESRHNTSLNPNELNTGLKTNHQGMYLSSLMITALSLINCSNISEINNWIDSVPNLYMISQLPNNGDYTNEQIDSIKRKLFEMYQDSMISTQVINDINFQDEIEGMRYALHKKFSGLGLSIDEEIRLSNVGLSKSQPEMYKQIKDICIEKEFQRIKEQHEDLSDEQIKIIAKETGEKIFSKIVYYFTSDYENFNSSTYEQMVALNEQIKQNIQRCNLVGGDFQLVLRSIGYNNTVSQALNDNGTIEYVYNYDVSIMGQELADKLGSSYRLRSMINRNAAEEMEKKFSKKDKDIIIEILRDSLKLSLEAFKENIPDDGKIRTFELFNELVEIQKSDKDFKLVWEEKFGITLKDMIDKIIMPNDSLIQDLKNKNVEFMYNETLLQEATEKREKVKETMRQLQKQYPGLITVFGDQDHTFSSDYTPQKIEQLQETAKFDKEMSEFVIETKSDGSDIKLKVECSERDLYLSKEEVRNMEQQGKSKDDILKYKQSLQNKHNEIFDDVPFKRECEWTVIDNISGDYFKNKQITKGTYIGKYTKISEMARKDNSQRINKDITDFDNWKSKVAEQKKKQSQKDIFPTKINKGDEVKSVNFTKRSDFEIKIAQQIKQKNMIIKQQKEYQRSLEKNKAKTLTKSSKSGNASSSGGFANILILTLITGFIAGAIFMVIYNILK